MIEKMIIGRKGSCAAFFNSHNGEGSWYIHPEEKILGQQEDGEYAYIFDGNLHDISDDTPVFYKFDELSNLAENVGILYFIKCPEEEICTKGELLDMTKNMLKDINEEFSEKGEKYDQFTINQKHLYDFATRILEETTWEYLSTIAEDVLKNDILENPECYEAYI
ncbi:MAG: hypothetical protein HDS11_02565 [Bacteroides sp.]|nr:hypothetical protein [Bacteroides sp.]